MIRRPPRSTPTDTLLPSPTLVRSPLPTPHEQPALVEAVRAVAPEFHSLGKDAKARPARRTGDVVALEAGAQFVVTRLEGRATVERPRLVRRPGAELGRSEEHTAELQSLIRFSYAVLCLKNKNY